LKNLLPLRLLGLLPANWAWLQAHVTHRGGDSFNAINLEGEKVTTKPGFQKSLHMAVEGHLHLEVPSQNTASRLLP